MKECKETGNYKGRCCCNCKYQKRVMKHPWNKGCAKGAISELMGYACGSPLYEGSGNVIFFDRKHGMCEMHEDT